MKINPQHKAFDHYYRILKEVQEQGGTNENALRRAFQGLLDTFGRERGWILMEEQRLPNGSRPDGTLVDRNTFKRGFWEAKDAKDDLETEIKKKIALGYPTDNTIFEDTRRAVLYQKGQPPESFDLSQPQWLVDLLERFFNHPEPAYDEYDQAAEEFKERIPDQARRLLALIAQERAGKNKAFQQAFEEFHTLCKGALNPNISVAAIDEMLVQHLMTEHLFRTIFDDDDFVRRNVIAAEIEKVIAALTSRVFNRGEFLQPLNRFYEAIEKAARTIGDWNEKQHFLNAVYERFFQGYSVKQADTYGIVYTPQEIVDFMVASVDEVLKREFGKDLSSPGVQMLDPCTGTGNFIVNILRRVSLSALQHKYEHDLFANEIMLLPYYIAALNIEHAYYDRARSYRPFNGLCFVDTLDMVLENRPQSLWLSEANTERIIRENMTEITVIIGNPPYNVGQVNENDNNKNRRYDEVDKRIRDTYVKDSKATSNSKLYDAYVKFFRWATDRLGDRDGIICFISNNSFVDQFAFDGMRHRLLQEFSQIYHLDLHGNVRQNPKLSGSTHNVFGIQVGVGITIAVRNSQHATKTLHYYRVPEDWRKSQKLSFLAERENIAGIEWQDLQPNEKHAWLTEGLRPEFDDFLPLGTKEAKVAKNSEIQTIFSTYSLGINTARDSIAYDFHQELLEPRIKRFIEVYNVEVVRWQRRSDRTVNVDDFVTYDDAKIKWSRDLKLDLQRGHYAEFANAKIRCSLYRPFCRQWLFFDRILNEEVYQFPQIFPTSASETENAVIIAGGYGRKHFAVFISNQIPNLNFYADPAQCFPFYTYNEDGGGRRENITDWALEQFRARYGREVGKWDVFHYVYALLHHPQYRERYAENLKRELPRIPLVGDGEAFARLVSAGARLKALHLGYEQAEPYPLRVIERPNATLDTLYHVTKMRLSPDKKLLIVNDALTLADLPPEVFQYRLGNRSALEWVIDQYQVSTDSRSGITSDPNRDDEPEYIAQLARRVVTVSLETVELVNALPALPEFAGG